MPQLAEDDPALLTPSGGAGGVAAVQLDASEDRREPGRAERDAELERHRVAEPGELVAGRHLPGLEHGLGLGHDVDARGGQLDLVAERRPRALRPGRDVERVGGPAEQRQRDGGRRQRGVGVREVGALVQQRLDERHRVVQAPLEEQERGAQPDEPVAGARVVEHVLRGLHDPLGLLGATQATEQVVGAARGDRSARCCGSRGLGLAGGQDLLGALVLPERVEADTQQAGGFGPAPAARAASASRTVSSWSSAASAWRAAVTMRSGSPVPPLSTRHTATRSTSSWRAAPRAACTVSASFASSSWRRRSGSPARTTSA